MAYIVMPITKSDYRNAFNNNRHEGNFKSNYQKIFKMRLPHMDTIDNVMHRIEMRDGYTLKHKVSRVSLIAAKNYYQCIQIAHLINQLLINLRA